MTKENKINFTEERLRRIPPAEAGKRTYYYDLATAGLRLTITDKGGKSFQVQAWNPEKQRSIAVTIGRWPAITLHSARAKAILLNAEIHDGADPQFDKIKRRDTMTVGEMLDLYLEEFSKPHNKTWQDDQTKIRLYLKPEFGKRLITELKEEQVRSWHNKTKKQFSPATANRRLALLRVAYNKVLPKGNNPCQGVAAFKEYSCERFLQNDELRRFFKAVEHERQTGNPDVADYVELSLLTGARQANVLGMRWNDIDINRNCWRIAGQDAKAGRVIMPPLTAEAVEILNRRKETASSVFVFPGPGKSGHLQEPWKGWRRILKHADIENCRLHDLRHTLASYQAMTGTPESIVGRTLGHQSVETTRKYTHMVQNTVLASAQKAVDSMKTPVEQKVVNIKKG